VVVKYLVIIPCTSHSGSFPSLRYSRNFEVTCANCSSCDTLYVAGILTFNVLSFIFFCYQAVVGNFIRELFPIVSRALADCCFESPDPQDVIIIPEISKNNTFLIIFYSEFSFTESINAVIFSFLTSGDIPPPTDQIMFE
jgi:hypothetical protein